jgi:thiamine biosynthesis lipoprotein
MLATCDSRRRLRPLLGTFVEIAAAGAAASDMEAAVEAAFAAVAKVHSLMSFHDGNSDVSRLNRGAAKAAIRVHEWTFQVLEAALDIHRHSNGLFDISVATALQRLDLLPYHKGDLLRAVHSVPGHIEMLPGKRVRFGDPATRIDLGGIAKGFAVDRAIDALRSFGIPSGLVNAGGDISVFGSHYRTVDIRHPALPGRAFCKIKIDNAAIASSGARFDPFQSYDPAEPAIIDPATGEPVRAVIGATVRAASCLVADALTKVVIIGGGSCAPVLRHFGASALLVSAEGEVFSTQEWHDAAVLAA